MKGLARAAVVLIVLMGAFASPASAAPAWVDLGGGAQLSGNNAALNPSLANHGGNSHVAWNELAASQTVRVARYAGNPFDAAPWAHLPGSPDSNPSSGGSHPPDMAVVNGSLHVTWGEEDGQSRKVRVAKFDNSTNTWSEVPASAPPSPINTSPTAHGGKSSIADIGGVAHVAWGEQPAACCDPATVRVKRFNGTSWVALGSDPNGVGLGLDPDIANIAGVPYVAYTDTDNDGGANGGSGWVVTVKRYDSSTDTWIQVGSGPNPISTYSDKLFGPPTLYPTITQVGGTTPYVAWTQPTGSGSVWQVRVKRFNGSSWEQPGGASLNRNAAHQATFASIHTVGGSQPHVAWLEDDLTNREVRVSRLSGSSWAELAGGDSPINQSSTAHAHSVNMGSVGSIPVVAWDETQGGGPLVFVAAYGDSPANTARPVISGTPKVGSGLSCSNGTWSGSPSQFKTTWERAPRATTADDDPAWNAINGAAGASYTVQAADAGSRVRCRVVASNAVLAGQAVSLSKRTDHDAPRPVGPPRVTGSPIAGSTMTCEPGEWTNSPDLTFQWIENGFPISGATEQTFRYPTLPYVDFNLLCRVTGTNDLGSWTSDLSPAVHVVGSPPRANVRPTLHLTGVVPNPVGARAECKDFDFTHDYGEYFFSWLRDGEEIPGATESTYTTTVDDLGRELSCRVSASNPLGLGDSMTSNRHLLALPRGNVSGQMARAGGRNEFDPVNFMAMADDFKAEVDKLVVERLAQALERETDRCRGQSGVPADVPVPNASDFPDPLLPGSGSGRLGVIRCAFLLHNRGAVDIGPYGVQYRGAVKYRIGNTAAIRECATPGNCPDLGFKVQPVDPTNVRTLLDQELLTRLAPVIPERVLWDVDGDDRTDVECPGEAPVMRTLLAKGSWKPRAVIVTRDSAATGVYTSVGDSFAHPLPENSKPARQRAAQAFVCRTSIEPPPDPEQSPCLTKGTIGRVEMTGNFCPVYLRAIPPNDLKGLPDDVYKVLSAMASQLKTARAKRGGVVAPALRTSSVQAAQFGDPLRATDTARILNTMSGVSTIDGSDILRGSQPRLVPDQLVSELKGDFKKLITTRANFAFDQIYWAKEGSPVTVNGVTVAPNGKKPTLLVPTEVNEAIESAGFNAMTINTPDAQLMLGNLKLAAEGQINARLEDARSKAIAVLRDQLDLDALRKRLENEADLLLGPFKLAGTEAKIKLENDGTATLTAKGEFDILKDPTTGKSLRVDLTLKADKTGKIELQGVEVTAPGALLGPVNLKDLFFRYDGGITVRGKILIPPHNEGVEIENFRLGPTGAFESLHVAYLAGAGSGIPIGTGVYLTKLGGGFTYDDTLARFALGATVSAGPSVGGGCPSVGLESDADVRIHKRELPTLLITITGQIKLVCVELGQIDFRAGSDGLVTLDGGIKKDFGPVHVSGGIHGKIHAGITDRGPELKAWQASLDGRLEVKDFLGLGDVGVGLEGAVSNKGIALCGIIDLPFIPAFKGGAAVNFPGGRPPLHQLEVLQNFRLLRGCDLSAYKPLGKRNFLRGAQAGATGFTVPAAAGGLVLSIEGAGDAPHVKLRSPSGKEYDFTAATEGVSVDGAYGEILEQEDRTIVILAKPEAGQWMAEPAEGSVPVNRVEFSRILPQPKIKGSVSGRGSSKVLSYSVAAQEGQEVRFVEDAPEGLKEIGVVKGGGRGTFRYTVGEAKGTSRTILAYVAQDGMPRTQVTVARYTAANPRVGRPGSVRVRRRGSRAIVTWRTAALAASYTVSVTTSDGTRSVYFPTGKARTVTIPGVARNESVAVSVVATSPAGRKGAPGRGKLAKPKKKPTEEALMRPGRGICCAATVCSLTALAVIPAGALAAWKQPVGGPQPLNRGTLTAYEPSLASVAGVPYVAWEEPTGSGHSQLWVSRLNAAGTAWEPVGGTAPLNIDPTKHAEEASLVAIGDVLWVAWSETDGTNKEIRVKRLDAAANAWVQVGSGASPINQTADMNAIEPSLTSIGGVPYVAWRETQPTSFNQEVRVARLNVAGTAWEKVGQTLDPASPINESATGEAREPSLTPIGGVPHVAWVELDGVNYEVRVARLNGAATGWDQVVGGASPINQAADQAAFDPSLSAVGSVPYVAWHESTAGGERQVRVSRLNAAGTAWQQVGAGCPGASCTSPINHAANRSAFNPSLIAIGGVPYVAWYENELADMDIRVSRFDAAANVWVQVVGGPDPITESVDKVVGELSLIAIGGVPYVSWTERDGSADHQVRVSRLEPDFLGGSETVGVDSATLSAQVRTFGVAYPIGFQIRARREPDQHDADGDRAERQRRQRHGDADDQWVEPVDGLLVAPVRQRRDSDDRDRGGASPSRRSGSTPRSRAAPARPTPPPRRSASAQPPRRVRPSSARSTGRPRFPAPRPTRPGSSSRGPIRSSSAPRTRTVPTRRRQLGRSSSSACRRRCSCPHRRTARLGRLCRWRAGGPQRDRSGAQLGNQLALLPRRSACAADDVGRLRLEPVRLHGHRAGHPHGLRRCQRQREERERDRQCDLPDRSGPRHGDHLGPVGAEPVVAVEVRIHGVAGRGHVGVQSGLRPVHGLQLAEVPLRARRRRPHFLGAGDRAYRGCRPDPGAAHLHRGQEDRHGLLLGAGAVRGPLQAQWRILDGRREVRPTDGSLPGGVDLQVDARERSDGPGHQDAVVRGRACHASRLAYRKPQDAVLLHTPGGVRHEQELLPQRPPQESVRANCHRVHARPGRCAVRVRGWAIRLWLGLAPARTRRAPSHVLSCHLRGPARGPLRRGLRRRHLGRHDGLRARHPLDHRVALARRHRRPQGREGPAADQRHPPERQGRRCRAPLVQAQCCGQADLQPPRSAQAASARRLQADRRQVHRPHPEPHPPEADPQAARAPPPEGWQAGNALPAALGRPRR